MKYFTMLKNIYKKKLAQVKKLEMIASIIKGAFFRNFNPMAKVLFSISLHETIGNEFTADETEKMELFEVK